MIWIFMITQNTQQNSKNRKRKKEREIIKKLAEDFVNELDFYDFKKPFS